MICRCGGVVKLVHNNIIIKIPRCFFGKALRVESLNGYKKIVYAFRFIAAYKHLPKVCIFQYCAKGVHTLFQNFFTMSHEQKSARLIRVLLAKTLVIKRRNHSLSGTGGGNNKVSVIATNLALCFQLIKNFLLIGIWSDIHRIHFGIITVKVFFGL